jgi:hypothetical protein
VDEYHLISFLHERRMQDVLVWIDGKTLEAEKEQERKDRDEAWRKLQSASHPTPSP